MWIQNKDLSSVYASIYLGRLCVMINSGTVSLVELRLESPDHVDWNVIKDNAPFFSVPVQENKFKSLFSQPL